MIIDLLECPQFREILCLACFKYYHGLIQLKIKIPNLRLKIIKWKFSRPIFNLNKLNIRPQHSRKSYHLKTSNMSYMNSM